MARKVVGVGSVGTDAWIVLLLGHAHDAPLFLQVKQAEASVLEPFLGDERVPQPRTAGRGGPAADAGRQRHLPRVGAHDPGRRGRDYYIRQLRDWKGSADIAGMTPAGDGPVGPTCADGPWPEPMPAPVTGSPSPAYLGRSDVFDRAMVKYAQAYADQNERDFLALHDAVRQGRVIAELGT